MSNKTRLLTSLVAGLNTALLLLIVMLGLELTNPGSVFGTLFAPNKAHAEANFPVRTSPIPVSSRPKAPPTPTIPPEVRDSLAVDIVQPGANNPVNNNASQSDWATFVTATPQKWAAKPTNTPVPATPTYKPPAQFTPKAASEKQTAPTVAANLPEPTSLPEPAPTLELTPLPAANPVVTEEPASPGIVPAKLHIPVVGIDAPVEPLGLDHAGRPDVPKNYWNVGWIKLGPKPGEVGNAVIDGHVDSPTAAAVFYNLRKLKVGDQVFVSDANGQQLIFEVFEIAIYPYNDAPLDKIFGHSTEAQLNLITCTGVFNRASQNYDKRFVAFTRLVGRA